MILLEYIQSNFPLSTSFVTNLWCRNTRYTLRVTGLSKAISVSESAASSLCERRQHPSMLHENNLPALFNLHTSSIPPAALPPKLTQMRRHEIVIFPRLCMKIKLGIAFVLDSLPCKQRSCFLIFM